MHCTVLVHFNDKDLYIHTRTCVSAKQNPYENHLTSSTYNDDHVTLNKHTHHSQRLPFFSDFLSLLFPRSLRLLSRSRDRDLLAASRSSLVKSRTLSLSHSLSERVLSLRSISRSLSAHWSLTFAAAPSFSLSRSFSRVGGMRGGGAAGRFGAAAARGSSPVSSPLWKSS